MLYFTSDLYIKPLHNCNNSKYEMYNLSDNLVLAVPQHSLGLRGQPAFTAYSTNSSSSLHSQSSFTSRLFIGVTESNRVEVTLS